MKGEFEKRLKSVIDEVQSSDTPIILFIDEAHTLIGAGGAAGTGDAANLLKPALARGELRTVAATTWAEYKQHIEPDPALTRRFQVVKVEEPSEEAAIRMCRGVPGCWKSTIRSKMLDEAIEACRAAVAPLYSRRGSSRQGDQPARHRLRAGRRVPARDACRGRGYRTAASRRWRSRPGSSTARAKSASTSVERKSVVEAAVAVANERT